MQTTIRPYQPTDLPMILDIINHYIKHSTAIYDYEPRTLADQQAIMDDKLSKGFPILVAMLEDCIVGFGYFSEFRFKQGYKHAVEHSVYIAPNHVGQGIGKQLLQALIYLAKEKNLQTMIGVIDAENSSSIHFHEQLGFINAGTLRRVGYKFDRWLDTVYMQLMV
jgi:phosphinothricin acetyltransferase